MPRCLPWSFRIYSTIPAISRLDYHVPMSVFPDQGRIHSLPGVLASQIAAGEVIERPASVVKELVENCLDAGAGRIQIDIEAAGSKLIRVRDDGDGIHPDDLSLAIAPHSTSKIRSVEDLAAIMSLGFRGEALASIAAVSRLRISSRHADQPAAEIHAEPGQPVAEPAPASHPAGTSIEVRDLFFNMPARRKFLRTEQTEFLHILELVKSLSLSRPQLGIRLTHNGRSTFNVSAGSDMVDRISRIFGSTFADAACTVDETAGSMRLHGVAGQSEVARSQADRQYVFLNGRLIRDRRLNHALRTAYQDILPTGRYAPFIWKWTRLTMTSMYIQPSMKSGSAPVVMCMISCSAPCGDHWKPTSRSRDGNPAIRRPRSHLRSETWALPIHLLRVTGLQRKARRYRWLRAQVNTRFSVHCSVVSWIAICSLRQQRRSR